MEYLKRKTKNINFYIGTFEVEKCKTKIDVTSQIYHQLEASQSHFNLVYV